MAHYLSADVPWYSVREEIVTVVVNNGVTSIGAAAFKNCTSLTSIDIPDGVTVIHNDAFRYCESLTSINIPDSVTEIWSYVFGNCESLTVIDIPNGVTRIMMGMFSNCKKLTTIDIPDSVTEIGSHAFERCESLTTIDIPDSVTSIGRYAFEGCTGLTTIDIPAGVTSIGSGAFVGCTNLKTVTMACNTSLTVEPSNFFGATNVSTINYIHQDANAYKTGVCSVCGNFQKPSLVNGVYQISYIDHLFWFAGLVNGTLADGTAQNKAANAILMNDITVNQNVLSSSGALNGVAGDYIAWPMIGTSGYSGTFDGNGKTVSGLYIAGVYTSGSQNKSGMFYSIQASGTVKNVTVDGSYISGGAGCAGIAYENYGTIFGCDFYGRVENNSSNVAGIVVNNKSGGVVEDCEMRGYFYSNASVGGIVSTNEGTVRGCSNYSSISITAQVGGIAYSNSGTIQNCTNYGSVKSGSAQAGGIVFTNNGTIKGCQNSGAVTGSTYAAGIAVTNSNLIQNCTNSGSVLGNNNGAGGIVATNSTGGKVQNCTNVAENDDGLVRSGGAAGGIVHTNESGATVTNCSNRAHIDARYTAGGIVYNNSGTVTYSYNAGTVTAGTVGMLVASNSGTVTTCYYQANSAIGTVGTNKTAAQFASGEETYLLNGSSSTGTLAWHQTIGTDAYPMLTGSSVVYKVKNCTTGDTVYRNVNENTNHAYGYVADTSAKTITKKCTACNGSTLGTVTLKAPTGNLTYNGSAKTATYTGSVPNETPTITYAGTNATNGQAINAGSYTATMSLGGKSVSVSFTIAKAATAPNAPAATMTVASTVTKVENVTLPSDWVWQDADKAKDLIINQAVSATAVYNGADKGNYTTESVTVAITRSACVTHTGGTATCTAKAVCTVCGNEYGTTNPANHVGDTEVRGALAATCEAQGYTGDTYCLGCDTVKEPGQVIPRVAHTYGFLADDAADTITKKCSACTDTPGYVTLNIPVTDGEGKIVYDGQVKVAVVTGQIPGKIPVVTYDGDHISDGQAVSAGYYTATMTVTHEETDYAVSVDFEIVKAPMAPNAPSATMSVANSAAVLGDVSLPGGWVWQDAETALPVGQGVAATAVYTGAGRGNYEVEEVSVTVTRSACNHTGGTATCKDKAVCELCHEPYGYVNPNGHVGETEVRGAYAATCTTPGYTGDIHCSDCGSRLSGGQSIGALGHNYQSQ